MPYIYSHNSHLSVRSLYALFSFWPWDPWVTPTWHHLFFRWVHLSPSFLTWFYLDRLGLTCSNGKGKQFLGKNRKGTGSTIDFCACSFWAPRLHAQACATRKEYCWCHPQHRVRIFLRSWFTRVISTCLQLCSLEP